MIREKKRKQFSLLREIKELSGIYENLPDDTQCYKAISDGGFSSIAFIKFVADRTHIKKMTASTLRVGRKHLFIIDRMRIDGKLDYCHFIVGGIMKNDSEKGKSYKYYDDLEKVCETNGWKVDVLNNHSKVILFDT